MKFYVTGRSDNYSKVAEAFATIKERGHEVTFEWTALPMVKPYDEHTKSASENAERGITGVTEADVYIIFTHKDGNGVYTEFGAALASHTILKKPRIFAIGKAEKGAAMFNYHPAVEWRDSIEAVLDEVM